MIANPVAIPTASFWLLILSIVLVVDIILLVDFLVFVWKVTRRPLWVMGALVFFKATTIPIVLGTIYGFYNFFINDRSLVNKAMPIPNIDLVNTPHNPKGN